MAERLKILFAGHRIDSQGLAVPTVEVGFTENGRPVVGLEPIMVQEEALSFYQQLQEEEQGYIS